MTTKYYTFGYTIIYSILSVLLENYIVFTVETTLKEHHCSYTFVLFGYNFLRMSPSGFSLQFSCSVVSDSLQPHESLHARPPCPSPTPRVHSDSHPLIQWCHPAISSSVVPFFSCPQSLPASDSLPMSQLFTWGGQSTGVSALASFLPNYLF